jgi:hypothetical protein
MDGTPTQPLGQAVKPGESVDISVALVAPEQPGTYTGEWMLQTPDGRRFGLGNRGLTPFWVRIVVP